MFIRWPMNATTLTTVLLLLTTVGAQKRVDNLFNNDEERPSLDNFKCPTIEGQLIGCHNCYLCDEKEITRPRTGSPAITRITLRANDCASTEVCCIAQGNLDSYRTKLNCGIENPEGKPPSIRNTSRSVLLGEYPWRAWVFSNDNDTKPLCAATFVADNINGFIVPASCLARQTEKTIYVVFKPKPAKTVKLTIKTILRHENYDGSQMNNLALVAAENMPETLWWVHPVCIPSGAVDYGTVCSSVSEDNNFVYSAIPQKGECDKNNGTVEPEAGNPSLNCSVSVVGDFEPQFGSGLFCLNENADKPMYFIYGMVMYRKHDYKIYHVDVNYFSEWIEKNVQKIFSKYFRRHHHVTNPGGTKNVVFQDSTYN